MKKLGLHTSKAFLAAHNAIKESSESIKHFDIPETGCWVTKSGLVAAFKPASPYDYGDTIALGVLDKATENVAWVAKGTNNKGVVSLKTGTAQTAINGLKVVLHNYFFK